MNRIFPNVIPTGSLRKKIIGNSIKVYSICWALRWEIRTQLVIWLTLMIQLVLNYKHFKCVDQREGHFSRDFLDYCLLCRNFNI